MDTSGTGTSIDRRIAMDDGVSLAATIYRPDSQNPAPCLLEALPYRKDDVTSSYAPEYERLRDEFGYAVCRLDLRGTGSSSGIATDEYPAREQDDLVAVVAWLAEQSWCDGNVGMYGTSYSGFNSIQVAMRRPPALKAIIPIFATDDRFTDDVHYMGGARRLLDIVDYPTYMIAMNALPPVPTVFGDGWRDEWKRRVDETEPWLLRWSTEQTRGTYWRHGSLRPDYQAITAPTMIVAGWADGYRNNTFRTYQALTTHGTPTRLLVGPWSHAAADSALPGPHVDLVSEMARWFDRWLRGADNGIGASTDSGGEPSIIYFARGSTPPEPDAPLLNGAWQAESGWPSARFAAQSRPLGGGVHTHKPLAGTGTSAWNSCAGALPYGQPTDQRFDDAASLTWDWPADRLEMLGHAHLRLRVAADQPIATVSAKLCDVAPDGTSTLITRGLLNLTHRTSSIHGKPSEPREPSGPAPLTPGEFVDVDVELEATSWTLAPRHRLRLAVTGMDWPNTIAAPSPFMLTIDGDVSTLTLPVALTMPVALSPATPAPATLATIPAPSDVTALSRSEAADTEAAGATAAPGAPAEATAPTDDDASVVWRISDDVLTRTTSAFVDHGSTYDARGGSCTDRYTGEVSIDRRTWRQRAISSASFALTWDDILVRTETHVVYAADEHETTIDITLDAYEGDERVAKRSWHETIPRWLG